MLLSIDEHQRIAAAVAAAEATTRGEIVCVVVDEVSRYGEVPIAWAVAATLLISPLLIAIAALAHQFDYTFGGWAIAHIAATQMAVQAALIAYAIFQSVLFVTIFAVVSIPAVRRPLTPAALKRGHVRARAMEHFFARNVQQTREQAGILLFVALKERRAELIADSGISDKVDQAAWEQVVADLTRSVRSNRSVDGFVTAITSCGHLLAMHFPPGLQDTNELPDDVIEA
jgi:putative membrane protein